MARLHDAALAQRQILKCFERPAPMAQSVEPSVAQPIELALASDAERCEFNSHRSQTLKLSNFLVLNTTTFLNYVILLFHFLTL